MKGRVISVHSAACRVAIEKDIVSCTFRGRLRLDSTRVYAGDIVTVSDVSDGCIIDGITDRRNLLLRPPVANVEQAIIVTAITRPPVDLLYIDRILVELEFQEIDAVICINKSDLEDPIEIEKVRSVYQSAGYPCVVTSAVTGLGLDALAGLLDGKVNVLAGQSGAGKSKLISSLMGVSLLTGELSDNVRGRHTTKWVKLFRTSGDGYVADTPGFSKIDLTDVEPHELGYLYPEIERHASTCHFPRCLHRTEDRCRVKDALSGGEISAERYSNYLALLDEAIERAKFKYE